MSGVLVRRYIKLFKEMIKYGFVSIVALCADLGILAFCTSLLHINYLISATISFTIGLIINYAMSNLWVFQNSKRLDNRKKEFIVFTIIGIIGLILNDLIIWSLTDRFKLFYFYSKLIATVIVFFWNFGLRKTILYKDKSVDKIDPLIE